MAALRQGLRAATGPAALLTASFLLALACTTFTRGTGQIAAVWPGNALAVAVLLRRPAREWPAFLAAATVGGLAASLLTDELQTAVLLSVCNVVEIFVCSLLTRRLIGVGVDLSRTRDLLVFCAVAAGPACVISGVAAATMLAGAGEGLSWKVLKEWYLADALGLLIVTPALLALSAFRLEDAQWRQTPARVALAVVILAASLAAVFAQTSYPLLFLILPALVLCAFQLGPVGAVLALLLTAVVAIVATLMGHGSAALIPGNLSDRLSILQGFLVTVTLVTLSLTATLADRRRLLGSLQTALSQSELAEQRLRLASQITGIGYWRREIDTGFVEWSDETFALHGVTRENFTHRLAEARSLYLEEDQTRIAETVEAAFTTGKPFDLKVRLRRENDGEVRAVHFKGEAERDDRGAVVAIFGVMRDITDEEAARQRIEQSEARFRLLAQSATDVVMQVDREDRIQFVSDSVRRYGYEPDDMVGRSGASFIHPDDVATVRDRVARIAAGEPRDPSVDTSYRVLTADGGHTWMEGNTAIVRDDAGQAVGLISHLRDVSDRRASTAALAESEARYRLLADAATDVVIKVDPDDVIKYVSPSARRYGYEPDDLIGQTGFSLVHPDDVQKVRALIADLFEKAEVDASRDRTYRVRKADGDFVWMEGNPALVLHPDGKVRAVISQLRDVSERVAALNLLADSELRYRLIAEKATDIISRTGVDSRVIYVSPSVREVTGHAAEDLVGRSLLPFMHPDDVPHVLESYRQMVDRERPEGTPLSYRARHKDGRWIWLECNPTPLRDAAGNVVEFIDVTRDVSVRKQIEDELTAARDAAEAAAAVKADFMANMSHEIRTPLTAILGFTSLVAARTDLAVDAQGHVQRITSASKALLAIVNDILDFSKLEAGLMPILAKPASPLETLSDALALFEPQAQARKLSLRLEGAEGLPAHLSLDPDRVRQVLLNLIGNAIKFSEQGEITVSARYHRKARRLHVSVKDCGVGMDADQQAKLFQRFSQVDASSTRRHGGTGLGLAICRGLVEAMGGEIGVDSAVGAGSVFTFSIKAPVCDPPAQADQASGVAGVSGLRLLVADDNRINRELARAILEPFGIEVAEAADGLAAIEMAMAMPYDVLLLDVRMPGFDGPTVAQQVRSRSGPNRDVPILAFSADYDMERFGEQAVRCFDGFVRKPLEPAALIETLARATNYESVGEEET